MSEMTGQELIERWVAFIRRYVALTEGQALTVALWAIMTHVYQRFYAIPYLEIWAEHKRSGKSTLGSVLAALSAGSRTLATVRVLSMAKIAAREKGVYTSFIEEAERYRKASLGDERSVIASGYQRGAVHEIEKGSYPTFWPKAFILIGNVHEVIRDRCISIKLGRSEPPQNWTNERYMATSEADDLVKAMRDVMRRADVTHTADGEARFKVVDPAWLMSARDREIWSPLFSIAAALRLHADTMNLLKRASVDLSILKTLPEVIYHPSQSEMISDDGNAAETVLRDAVSVLREDDGPVVPSTELVSRLQGIDTAVWRGWRGDGLTTISLGALLKRFGISSEVGQHGKGKARKQFNGYRVAVLRAALIELDRQRGK